MSDRGTLLSVLQQCADEDEKRFLAENLQRGQDENPAAFSKLTIDHPKYAWRIQLISDVYRKIDRLTIRWQDALYQQTLRQAADEYLVNEEVMHQWRGIFAHILRNLPSARKEGNMEFEMQVTALERVAGPVEWRASLVKRIQQDLLAQHRHLLQNVEEREFLLEELFANAKRASLVLERNEGMMRIAKIIEDNVYLKAEINLGLRRRRERKDSGSPQPSNATSRILHHYGRRTHLSPPHYP